mmetsp:Transcript_44337/g.104977  ORF Transcript_44337/g.104977 Transcript_44337/m.104977 type:complete len:224 (+) Transcript_44337:235-906(+)
MAASLASRAADPSAEGGAAVEALVSLPSCCSSFEPLLRSAASSLLAPFLFPPLSPFFSFLSALEGDRLGRRSLRFSFEALRRRDLSLEGERFLRFLCRDADLDLRRDLDLDLCFPRLLDRLSLLLVSGFLPFLLLERLPLRRPPRLLDRLGLLVSRSRLVSRSPPPPPRFAPLAAVGLGRLSFFLPSFSEAPFVGLGDGLATPFFLSSACASSISLILDRIKP